MSKSNPLAEEHSLTNGHAEHDSSTTPFLDILANRPHSLLYPSPETHQAALQLAKFYLDPVARDVSNAQIARRDEARKTFKRKRKVGGFEDSEEEREMDIDRKGANVLKMRGLALEGFETQQVWEQVNKIAKAVEDEVERVRRRVEKEGAKNHETKEDGDSEESSEEVEEDDMSDVVDGAPNTEAADNDDLDAILDDDEFSDEDEGDNGTEGEDMENFVKDKFGLNDGFFSIDEFNRRTEALESLDARGEPEAPSDEEDIDWDANPATLSLETKKISRKGTREEDHDEDGEEESEVEGEDGPTFGDMDLDAPEGASEDELDDDKSEGSQDEEVENLMYEDFFGPRRKKSGNRQSKTGANTERLTSRKDAVKDDFENDLQRTISAVHRELYSDDSGEEDESKLPANASSHEKRQAALVAQIRELEAENVAKRSWTLMGETRAQDRPRDAALEEDLDFERAGKPLPIITKETSEEIEELIKRRILAGEFDEVRRRRPEDVYSALSKSGRQDSRFEEDLAAPRRGLAEVYEEEHLRKTDPNFVDQKSDKLNKEHTEIEALWKDISIKLDSLASWNYKPKPPEISVTVRADAPALSLEDIRPTGAGGEVGTMNQLAPQEVFAPGDVKEKGKLVTKGGTVLDRAELSRDQKRRIRQREKERGKKRASNKAEKPSDKHKDERSSVVHDLKKGGVKVIGKKGELQDVDGKQVKEASRVGGSTLRL